ncbi:hypothetical protein [Leptodesmis sichuanensis]|uniref:hypothetical protein n=1 Tax=Leptodesmis sichuanensis TaxID=2906798 RepID=UPI001F39A7BD|nr:hypothetical protein [Leptodesmis sichuanensis]UIE40235.1 hypothetical protein KIK02_12275 [Leptodesmis sichuanensis A121]
MTLGVGRADHNILDFIKEYLQSRGLLKKDFLRVQGRKRVEYWSESHFWQDVLQTRQVYDTCQVLLKDFQLIHWIPRAPGQYYTRDARHSREAAQHFVVARERNHVVFDPYGKSEMVKGGVGCLRLLGKQIGGERLHFLCATSSGIAHKGLLVGLPRNLYERVIEDIERKGAVICSIFGQIRYWADEEILPTYAPRNIPRMYLYANKIDISRIKPDAIDVTAAVLFRGTVDREEGTFFVYSHFNPCERHSIDNTIDQCIDWMERKYVRGLYDGQILTDFDEVTPRFEDVIFPVRALMNPRTDRRAMIKMCSELYLHQSSHDREAVETLVEHIISERTMTMNITITGDGNVVGNNNKVVTKINEGLSGQDVRQLGEAFALFRAEVLQIDAPEKVRNRAVRAIEDAEEEAADKSPDPKTIEDSLKRAKDILESADQVYDKSVNWGKRLSTLAQVLMRTIPAGWTWLSSVL